MLRELEPAELGFVAGGGDENIGWKLVPGEAQIALSIHDLNPDGMPTTTDVYGPVDGEGGSGGGFGGDPSSPQTYYADPVVNNAFLQALQEVRDLNINLGTDTLETPSGSSINGTVVEVGGNMAFFFGTDGNGSAFGVRLGPDQGND